MKGDLSLKDALANVSQRMDTEGLDAVMKASGRRDGDLARPRSFEIASAINRLRQARFRIR
jgi:predicted ABC-class ATPase